MNLDKHRRGLFDGFDNRELAKSVWLFGSAAIIVTIALFWTEQVGQPTHSLDYGPFPETVKRLFIGVVVAVTVGSFNYPARRIEPWLDERYPDYEATELEEEYVVFEDATASLGQGLLWSVYAAAIYGFTAITIWSTGVLSMYQKAGFELSTADMKTLTILNSFGVLWLAAAIATYGVYRAADRLLKPAVKSIQTPATSSMKYEHTPPTLADGSGERESNSGSSTDGDHA